MPFCWPGIPVNRAVMHWPISCLEKCHQPAACRYTFYQSFADVPAYDNYAMKGRAYRYFNGKVQYPFGYGLSYTSFAYDWQKMPANIRTAKDSVSFSIKVKNTGSMDGDEVVQVYVEYPPVDRMPLKELKAFKRVHVKSGW